MFGKLTQAMFGACNGTNATNAVEGADNATPGPTVLELLESLDGLGVRVSEAPDIRLAILEVEKRDGLDGVDPSDFSLAGLKCRAKLSVSGSVAQLAGMAASKAAQKVFEKAAALTGAGIGNVVAEGAQKLHGSLAKNATEASETKSMEASMYLDLEVRGAGEEVTAAVSIAPNAFQSIEQLIPVPTAVSRIEAEIAMKVRAIIAQ
eukprot:CAMPEP_0179289598 /NCGR_PEP_ID=MMETSP0797-20121207/41383_1 /TAXON_ID=47934 /ORGANISM="Dinophysis acuminata, Strain DAEP01" /LENGTH=205 /DNA_ID=CAMNT_0020998605 /DNA_START=81 /DNA_END=698 /DNA_ORIENTATION=+